MTSDGNQGHQIPLNPNHGGNLQWKAAKNVLPAVKHALHCLNPTTVQPENTDILTCDPNTGDSLQNEAQGICAEIPY